MIHALEEGGALLRRLHEFWKCPPCLVWIRLLPTSQTGTVVLTAVLSFVVTLLVLDEVALLTDSAFSLVKAGVHLIVVFRR